MKLAGKVVVVTGGGVGIGRKTALLLAREGAKVAVTDIDENNGQATVDDILNFHGEAIFVVHDVNDQDEWNRVVKEVLHEYSHIDLLFNNAGLYQIQCGNQYEEQWVNSIANTIRAICKEVKSVSTSVMTQSSIASMDIPSFGMLGFSGAWSVTNSIL
ncbi:SDR family NAD(P)-dependent oxidoreductase [Ectobacillus sp. sgz5001026]|uniref:SDR family NAD(P)-dependent oxidoreductase n=1 Tax=Ectobacillus sp. sgz5001026 TaxID=3242473 RepID=UPI0036D29488